MKKLLFIYLAFGLSVAVSQNKQLLYNWEVTPQTLMLNPGALVTNQFHAGKIAAQLANMLGGNGGGKPDMAMAGGSDPTSLQDALNSVQVWVERKI